MLNTIIDLPKIVYGQTVLKWTKPKWFKYIYKGRPIEIESVYGDCEDTIMIEKAYWLDTMKDIENEDILDQLTKDYYSELHSQWYEDKVCEAEYLYEGDR